MPWLPSRSFPSWPAAARRPGAGGCDPADEAGDALFLVRGRKYLAGAFRRDVVPRVPPPWGSTAGGALEALLAGPTAEEAAAGFTTAIPRGTRLISLRSHGYSGTGAVVNLSGLDRVADSLDRARIITQIVRTLATRVWLLEEGELWGMYLMDGGVDNGPFDYDTLLGFHLGVACPGTGTVECDRFDALP